MKTILLAAASLVTLRAEAVEGVITDTMCGAKHTMAKDMSDAECVKMCAKGSSDYALFDGKTVWSLSNQKLAAQFVAKHVVVSGDVNAVQKKIKVAEMKETR